MMSRNRILDLWFTAFPVWTTAFYAWFFWFFYPLEFKVISPTFFPPGHPNYVSWPMFLVFATSAFAMAVTGYALAFVVERRMRPEPRRWWWVLVIIAIPPLGCTLAYFREPVAATHSQS